jgi:hypothetical protein
MAADLARPRTRATAGKSRSAFFVTTAAINAGIYRVARLAATRAGRRRVPSPHAPPCAPRQGKWGVAVHIQASIRALWDMLGPDLSRLWQLKCLRRQY